MFSCLLSLPPYLNAANYFAANNGNGLACSLTAPCTINQCVITLAAGDTCFFRGGTYSQDGNEKLTAAITSGMSPSNMTKIYAYPGEIPILKPTSSSGPIFRFGTSKYVEVKGIVIDGTNVFGDDETGVSFWRADFLSPGHNRFMDGEIRHCRANGVDLFSSFNELRNSLIHNNGIKRAGYYHGVYNAGANNTISGNSIYNNVGWGVHQYTSSSSNRSNNLIYKNRLYSNGMGKALQCGGLLISSGHRNYAYNNLVYSNVGPGMGVGYNCNACALWNNTLYHNASYGIVVSPSGGRDVNNLVQNNIIIGSKAAAIRVYSSATGTSVDHNDLYNNDGSNKVLDEGKDSAISNNIAGNPLLVDPPSDMSIPATSPAKDGAITLKQVTDDFSGTSRPQASAYDIGAYECEVKDASGLRRLPMGESQ
jgi:hypothetical protein